MTAIEAARIAQAAKTNKELTPEKLAGWMSGIYDLIKREAMDGGFTMNLRYFLTSHHDIERNGHLPTVLEELQHGGYDVRISTMTKQPVISWLPK